MSKQERKLLLFPDKRLLTPTVKVDKFDDNLIAMLDDMYKAMLEKNGLGLASNQIGYNCSTFVMKGPEGRLNIINPTITAHSFSPANLKEGCLSAPGQFIVVPGRAEWVQIKYQDEYGNYKSIVLNGIHSVCAQHEMEHLEGKSFMEHKSIAKPTRKELAKKWRLK